jgi:hypothetical protein
VATVSDTDSSAEPHLQLSPLIDPFTPEARRAGDVDRDEKGTGYSLPVYSNSKPKPSGKYEVGKTPATQNSAARCRERLHGLLENLWETVPENERIGLKRKGGGDDINELSRADKIGIVVSYMRKLKAEVNSRY